MTKEQTPVSCESPQGANSAQAVGLRECLITNDQEAWLKDRLIAFARLTLDLDAARSVRADDSMVKHAFSGAVDGTALEIICLLGLWPARVNLPAPVFDHIKRPFFRTRHVKDNGGFMPSNHGQPISDWRKADSEASGPSSANVSKNLKKQFQEHHNPKPTKVQPSNQKQVNVDRLSPDFSSAPLYVTPPYYETPRQKEANGQAKPEKTVAYQVSKVLLSYFDTHYLYTALAAGPSHAALHKIGLKRILSLVSKVSNLPVPLIYAASETGHKWDKDTDSIALKPFRCYLPPTVLKGAHSHIGVFIPIGATQQVANGIKRYVALLCSACVFLSDIELSRDLSHAVSSKDIHNLCDRHLRTCLKDLRNCDLFYETPLSPSLAISKAIDTPIKFASRWHTRSDGRLGNLLLTQGFVVNHKEGSDEPKKYIRNDLSASLYGLKEVTPTSIDVSFSSTIEDVKQTMRELKRKKWAALIPETLSKKESGLAQSQLWRLAHSIRGHTI